MAIKNEKRTIKELYLDQEVQPKIEKRNKENKSH